MRQIFTYIGVILLLGFTACVQVREQQSSSVDAKFFTNAVQQANIAQAFKSIEVENSNGAIEIIGTDNEIASWDWNLEVRAPDEFSALAAIGEAACKVVHEGEKLRVIVTLPDHSGKARFTSNLKIRVPTATSVRTHNQYGMTGISNVQNAEVVARSGAVKVQSVPGEVRADVSYATLKVRDVGSASLKNSSGSIEAIGVHGALEAETAYASLTARDISGAVTLRNRSGSVAARDVAGDADIETSYAAVSVEKISGNLSVLNQSGSISAKGVSGNVKAETSYAAMTIDGAGAEIICDNQSGSIDLRASPAITRIQAKTSYASLTATLPSNLKPAIQARTSYSEIESDFPVMMKLANQNPFGDVPDSVPRVTLLNQTGRIRVTGY